VNSPQVVINRAFLYNNPIVFGDFVPGAPDRDAFLKLLSTGAIVQLLVTEQTPADTPAFLENQSAVKRSSNRVSAAQLAELLRGTAFDFVQETLFFDTFAKLSMQDVWDVRHSEQCRPPLSARDAISTADAERRVHSGRLRAGPVPGAARRHVT
jgi:hypothetical protein